MDDARGSCARSVAVLAFGLVAVTSALAASIVGTPRADVLRGTARADTLLGKGGNDTLYGVGGNDVLTGGTGKDRFCGTGRDVANTQVGESDARDCEVVRRAGSTPAPPLTPDLSFAFDYSGPLASGSSELTDIQSSYTIRGRFALSGQASGTVAISTVSFTYEGTRYSCTQNAVTWSTSRQ